MKILIHSYNLCTQNESGGVNIRIREVYKHLTKHGYKAKLFNKFEDKVADYDVLQIFKVDVENLGLIKFAKKNNVPVVISSIVTASSGYKVVYNLLLSKLFHIRSSYRILQESMMLADIIISESVAEKNFINKYYKIPKSKITVIGNGASLSVLSKDEQDLVFKKLGGKRDYILQVGRFDENKNQMNLIRAMNNTEIDVIFIGGSAFGDDTYFERCKQIANTNTHFWGWVDNSSPLLASAYKNAKVVVLPSYNETFGISIVEGGLAGANLALSKNLPINEFQIFNEEYLFDPANVDDIKTKVLKAFNDDKTDDIRNKIINLFSWDSIIEEYIKIYRDIV